MNTKTESIVSIISVASWFFLAFYFAMAGLNRIDANDKLKEIESRKVELQKDTLRGKNSQPGRIYKEIEFTTRYDLEKFKAIDRQEFLFKWLYELPELVGTLVTACAFALFGAIVDLIRQVVQQNKKVYQLNYFSIPLLGWLSGVAVLGLTYLLPSLLVIDDKGLRPQTLIFLCFFGGLYSTTLFSKLSKYFTKIFS